MIDDATLKAIADRDDDETITRVARELLAYRDGRKTSAVLPTTSPDSNTDTRYRDLIHTVAKSDADRLLKKDTEYGASWKKRGGVGAYFTMIRKVDRLNTQLPHAKHGYDILAALNEPTMGEESLLDTIRDLRGYLILIEAELLVRLSDDAIIQRAQKPVTNYAELLSAVSDNSNNYAEWPKDIPAQYNGQSEPCDMWTGPCCCGATHRNGV